MKFMPINVGDEVTGTYFGEPFSGIVANVRWNTMNHQRREIRVALDSPVFLNGGTRERVSLSVFVDGSGEYGSRVDSLVSPGA